MEEGEEESERKVNVDKVLEALRLEIACAGDESVSARPSPVSAERAVLLYHMDKSLPSVCTAPAHCHQN